MKEEHIVCANCGCSQWLSDPPPCGPSEIPEDRPLKLHDLDWPDGPVDFYCADCGSEMAGNMTSATVLSGEDMFATDRQLNQIDETESEQDILESVELDDSELQSIPEDESGDDAHPDRDAFFGDDKDGSDSDESDSLAEGEED